MIRDMVFLSFPRAGQKETAVRDKMTLSLLNMPGTAFGELEKQTSCIEL